MDEYLHTCISQCTGQKVVPDSYDKVFLYVKNYCGFSKRAAAKAINISKDVRVLDVLTNRYVEPMDFFKGISAAPKKLVDVYPTLVKKGMRTVPQIFVCSHGKWCYVGGNSDFTVPNNSSSKGKSMSQQVKF